MDWGFRLLSFPSNIYPQRIISLNYCLFVQNISLILNTNQPFCAIISMLSTSIADHVIKQNENDIDKYVV